MLQPFIVKSTHRYMKCRCDFLDNLPAFNYNTGVAKSITIKQGKQVHADTRQQRSTLMTAMLKEVEDFCDIMKNWPLKTHQQVTCRNGGIMYHDYMMMSAPFLFSFLLFSPLPCPKLSSTPPSFPFFPLPFPPLPTFLVDL